jgi:hypothetical protein
MSFIEAFFGSTQSQFSAYAIFAAVISICISIILTGTDMTIGNRFLLIFFVILAVLPSVLLMLLQITCMVTGGSKDERWWCWLYSWIIAIFVIIYCVFVVIISLTSLFTYNNAISKVDVSEQNNKMTPENSNNYAKMMIQTSSKEEIEKFMNSIEESEDTISNNEIVDSFGNSPEMLKQKFESGSGSNIDHSIQKFSNDDKNIISSVSSSMPSIPSISSISSMLSKNSPTSQSDTQTQITPPLNSVDKFVSGEMLDDEPEPFTNRNYASFR